MKVIRCFLIVFFVCILSCNVFASDGGNTVNLDDLFREDASVYSKEDDVNVEEIVSNDEKEEIQKDNSETIVESTPTPTKTFQEPKVVELEQEIVQAQPQKGNNSASIILFGILAIMAVLAIGITITRHNLKK